jgi:hypothetical protein
LEAMLVAPDCRLTEAQTGVRCEWTAREAIRAETVVSDETLDGETGVAVCSRVVTRVTDGSDTPSAPPSPAWSQLEASSEHKAALLNTSLLACASHLPAAFGPAPPCVAAWFADCPLQPRHMGPLPPRSFATPWPLTAARRRAYRRNSRT